MVQSERFSLGFIVVGHARELRVDGRSLCPMATYQGIQLVAERSNQQVIARTSMPVPNGKIGRLEQIGRDLHR